jgi:biopolymer transport protein TolR
MSVRKYKKLNNKLKRKAMAEINVVPYIDVMLVLLIIFVVTAPLLTQGVNVNLPKAKAKVLAMQNQEPIIVSVDKKGLLYLNVADSPHQPMSKDKLLTRISAQILLDKQKQHESTVLVKGDSGVDYGAVIKAFVLLQKAGVKKIGLMTEDIG